MLQTNKAFRSLDPDNVGAEVASPAEAFQTYIAFARRQYPVIMCVFLLALVAGTIYLFTATPYFTGDAVMVIDTRRVSAFQNQQQNTSDPTVDSATVDTQIEILKSENVARAVIKDLHLQ